MQIHTIKTSWASGELKQNTYIVEGETTCIIIDAGCPIQAVKKITSKHIEAVFITHGHFDHINYIEEYDKLGIPIYANENIKEFLTNTTLNASYNEHYVYTVKNIVPICNGNIIETLLGNVTCYETPGHSKDNMCYLIDGILFSGDTVFSIAVGRTDLESGDVETQIETLEKVNKIDYHTLYAGHGRISTKQEQLANIPKWINILQQMRNKEV